MPSLLIHNLEPEIIEALKQRAAQHGHSPEMEHRHILTEALLPLKKRSFAEALAAIPNVGQDSDFERQQNSNNPIDVE